MPEMTFPLNLSAAYAIAVHLETFHSTNQPVLRYGQSVNPLEFANERKVTFSFASNESYADDEDTCCYSAYSSGRSWMHKQTNSLFVQKLQRMTKIEPVSIPTRDRDLIALFVEFLAWEPQYK